jgi:hypothetical protein
MPVELKNWRMRSPLYHTQIYPTIVKPLGGSEDNYEVMYPGFMSGFDPQGFMSPTDFDIADGIYDITPPSHTEVGSFVGGDYEGVPAENWHSKITVVAGDKKNYAVGFGIICCNTTLGRATRWRPVYCVYTKQNPTWEYVTFGEYITITHNDDFVLAFNQLSQYYYLAWSYNNDGFPTTGGIIYTTTSDITNYHSMVNLTTKLITALRTAGDDTEENPDPQPTPIKNDDPYAPGGNTWTGGGNGKFDPTTDDVGIPGLPALSATSTGFITLFNPSVGQLRNLANYMWSGLFDIDTFRKIFADPMDCILGLSIVPVNVPSGGSAHVMVGNIDTGISMTTASAQYVEVDCGSIDVEENYGAYLDYEPYTKAELFLPYIGIHAISIDDIMDKTVTIKYHIDILSGACVAYVKCGASVLYSFIGQCASSIPITGNDWTNVINGVLSIAGSIGSMVATGGATAPMSVAGIASTAVNSMKPSIEKSGSLSGTGGMLGIQTPYLILTRPRQAIPAGQNRFIGYPSFITQFLRDVSGYTEVESIHLEGIQATGAELSEIETILKSGVIF